MFLNLITDSTSCWEMVKVVSFSNSLRFEMRPMSLMSFPISSPSICAMFVSSKSVMSESPIRARIPASETESATLRMVFSFIFLL